MVIKYNARTIQKHDTSANWGNNSSFIPLAGEIIVYDDLGKVKIGDGETNLGNLPFMLPSKADIGLSDVDNTSDADKPISSATQTALDEKINKTSNGIQIISFTVSDTPLALQGSQVSDSWIGFKGSDASTFGYLGVTSDQIPKFANADSTRIQEIILKDTFDDSINKLVPYRNSNGASYTSLASKSFNGSIQTYTRISFPSVPSWTMLTMELTIRENYNAGLSGKLIIYANQNSVADWQTFYAIYHDNLSSNIKVYGSDRQYIYISGIGAWGGVSIDRMLVGDNATTHDLTNMTIDQVAELPETYQTAVMKRSWTQGDVLADENGNVISSVYVKTIGNTYSPTIKADGSGSDTPLYLQSGNSTGAYIGFRASDGNSLGYFGVTSGKSPRFSPAGGSNQEIITSSTIGAQTVDKSDKISLKRSSANDFFPLLLANKGTTGTTEAAWDNIYAPVNNTVTINPHTGVIKAGIADSGNGTAITFAYSKAGVSSTNWFACWNGYELRAISSQLVLDTIGAQPKMATTFTRDNDTYISVRTSTRTANQYYEFWDSNIGWADIHAGSFTANGNFIGNLTGNAATATQASIASSGSNYFTAGGSANSISDKNNRGWSVTIGSHLTADSEHFVIGHYNSAGKDSNGGGSGDAFIIGKGYSGSLSNAFRVEYNGTVYSQKSTISTGADYAEYFEWQDGNSNNEDRRGYFVTLDKKMIRIAQPGDYILGIVSALPSVIGNGDEDWRGRYIYDEFGNYIEEEFEYQEEVTNKETGEVVTVTKTGIRWKENPDYDPSIPYIQRADRPEWDAVGMVGVLAVRDDGTCQVNGYCKVAAGGIATATDSDERYTYRVIERVNDHVVKVIFK